MSNFTAPQFLDVRNENNGRVRWNCLGISNSDGGGREWWIEDEYGEQILFVGNDKHHPQTGEYAIRIAEMLSELAHEWTPVSTRKWTYRP